METKVIVFTGEELDEYGMPTPSKFYGIIASEDEVHKGQFKVTTLGMSSDVDSKTQGHRIIEAPSATVAIEIVVSNLKNHADNIGLRVEEGMLARVEM